MDLIEAINRGDLEQVKEILDSDGAFAKSQDASGATPLHYAAIHGHRQMVQVLLECGAEIYAIDGQFGATPAGWAIEYLREMGGQLAIELDDLAYSIRLGDERWVSRFLKRFPSLHHARDTEGKAFRELARKAETPRLWCYSRWMTNPPTQAAVLTDPTRFASNSAISNSRPRM